MGELQSSIDYFRETEKLITFSVFTEPNTQDVFVDIFESKEETKNVNLRVYCFNGSGNSKSKFSTYFALRKLEDLINGNKRNKFKFQEFLKEVSYNIPDGILTISFDSDKKHVKIYIKQLKERGYEDCEYEASVAFSLEDNHENTDELIIKVNKEVFYALANIQHAIADDNKSLSKK